MTNKTMYLSVNPQPVTGITIRRIIVDGWDFQIILGDTAYFHVSGQDACDIVFSLATAIHDAGFIDDATARRLAYIGQSYEESTIPTCDYCGVPEENSTLEWNGETGCHFFCEQREDERPLPEPEYDDTDERAEMYEEGR